MRGLLILLTAVFAAVTGAVAQTSAPALPDYLHRRWTLEDGAPPVINAIVQSKDGFLWIGALSGLYRFDGVRFERIPRLEGRSSNDGRVYELGLAPDGAVIVNDQSGGFGRVCGAFICDYAKTSVPGGRGAHMVVGPDGALWTGVTVPNASLGRYADGRWALYGPAEGLPDETVNALRVTRNGVLWVLMDHRIAYLRPGSRRFEVAGDYIFRNAALAEDSAGGVWISDNYTGTRRLPDYPHGEAKPDGAPLGYIPSGRVVLRAIAFDRDGMLWGATRGLGAFQIREPDGQVGFDGHSGRAGERLFRAGDGLTSDFALSVFSDREGNVWVGTALGLDMFRKADIAPAPNVTPAAASGYQMHGSSDGAVWIADAQALYRVAPEGGPPIRRPGHFPDPQALCDGADGSLYVMSTNDLRR